MGTTSFQDALRAAQQGRADGVRALVRAHQPALSRVLVGLAVPDVEATSVRIWQAVLADLAGFSGDEYGLRAWLIDVAQQVIATAPRGGTDPATRAPGPDADETVQTLAMMRALPSDEATAVLLRVVAGLDSLTVADRTAEGGGRTRQLYQRGLAALVRLRDEARYRAGELGERALGHPQRSWSWQDVPADRVDELLDHGAAFEPDSDLEEDLVEVVRALRAPDSDAELSEVSAVVTALRVPPRPPASGFGTRAVGALLVAGLLTAGTIGAATAAAGSVQDGLARLVSFVSWEPGWMQHPQDGAHAVAPAPDPHPGDRPGTAATSATSSLEGHRSAHDPLGPPPAPSVQAPVAPPTAQRTTPDRAPSADPDPALTTPAADRDDDEGGTSPSTGSNPPVTSPSAPLPTGSPAPTASAPADPATLAEALALCRQWTAVQATPGPTLSSDVLTRLAALAGGAERIADYCSAVITAGSATPTANSTPATGGTTAPAAGTQSPGASGGEG